jgi:FPC/CPF motif-containing protein YcgG
MTADEAVAPAAPGWFRDSVERYRATMLDDADPYPCHFGVRGERTGVNRYTYTDGTSDDVGRVAGALVTFAELQRGDPSDVKRTLVVFARTPTSRDRATQFAAFWSFLQSLHAVDPRPWPERVPRDPTDPRWEFCFAGEPWFVIATSPAEALRRSRRIADHPVYFFQVKRIFADLGGETAAGHAAKRLIRRRLVAYDNAPAPTVLGDAAHSSASKWRQYFLPPSQPGDDVSGDERCPFRYEERR